MDKPDNFKKYKLKNGHKDSLEPHEIFLDAELPRLSEVETERLKFERPIHHQVLTRLFLCAAMIFVVLSARAFYLQMIRYDYFLAKSEKNASRFYQIPALRGIMYDSHGAQLVFNEPAFDLLATPRELPAPDRLNEAIARISSLTGVSRDELTSSLDASKAGGRSFIVLSSIPRDAALSLEAESANFPGFKVQQAAVRRYGESSLLSHLLGYLGKMTEEEIGNNPDYSPTEYIGKSGLELSYERTLRGRPGTVEVEVDSMGNPKKETVAATPQAGKNLILSVDLELEKKIYEALESALTRLNASQAAAVALDPQTGDVLALVSVPGFDANLFAKGISFADYQAIAKDPLKPLFNRAIAGTYPSGSLIKPLLAAAALQEGVVTPNKTILSTGGIVIRNQYSDEIAYTFNDWKIGGHGAVNMIKALAESVNTYFYTIGGGYGDVKGLGLERIKRYAELFGWGTILGIDVPGEKAGLIPDEEWKKNVKGERWYVGDTYNISIGQGDVAITPLQVSAAVAAIANNGTLYQPKLVKKIIEQQRIIEEVEPRAIRNGFISAANLEVVRRGMREAVVSGSSRALFDLPVKAAGKTGTAQFKKDKTHAWFSGFAPYENPEIVITVLIEEGGEGSSAAVPVAKEVLQWYFEKQKN